MSLDANPSEKVHLTLSPWRRAWVDLRVTCWLLTSSYMMSFNRAVIDFALRRVGVINGLGAHLDRVVEEAGKSNQHERVVPLYLFGIRILSIAVVLDHQAMKAVYEDPHRSQFALPSVLALAPGNNVFFHQQLEGQFKRDREVFVSVLRDGRDQLTNNVKKRFTAALANESQWQTTPILTIVRKTIFIILAETFLGLKSDECVKALCDNFEELSQLLSDFDRMWQDPSQMRPLQMRRILLRLDELSNQLHELRDAAPLLDHFAQQYGRSLNMTALFFVSSNLVRAITHTIIMGCSAETELTSKLSSELTEQEFKNDLIRLILRDAFKRDACIFRIDPWRRRLTVIPNGYLSRKQLEQYSYKNPRGRITEPYLFGTGAMRACPGRLSVIRVVECVLELLRKKKVFVPNTAQVEAYKRYINADNDVGDRCSAPPEVTGSWVDCQQLQVGTDPRKLANEF